MGRAADFQEIAGWVREQAPDIDVVVVPDEPIAMLGQLFPHQRPMMVVAAGPIARFDGLDGAVFQGVRLHKAQEYRALEACGIPVPAWALVTPNSTPDLSGFGPYVVVKPNYSGRGADVKIKRSGRVRWSAPRTRFTRRVAGSSISWIAQAFVYTGPWPVSYRVTTYFGEILWAWRVEASHERRQLRSRYDFRHGATGGGMSIVSSGKGCRFSLNDEAEILALGRRAHAAFPNIPLLGVDIVRDADSGLLYVIEVNAVGYTWHFSSIAGDDIQRDFDFRLEDQFDGRRKAARLLIERTRQYAR